MRLSSSHNFYHLKKPRAYKFRQIIMDWQSASGYKADRGQCHWVLPSSKRTALVGIAVNLMEKADNLKNWMRTKAELFALLHIKGKPTSNLVAAISMWFTYVMRKWVGLCDLGISDCESIYLYQWYGYREFHTLRLEDTCRMKTHRQHGYERNSVRVSPRCLVELLSWKVKYFNVQLL